MERYLPTFHETHFLQCRVSGGLFAWDVVAICLDFDWKGRHLLAI
jgi:hypothetical protein